MAYITVTRRGPAAIKYIYRIRNHDKREYAIRYYDYLRGRSQEPEPTNIGYMAAQEVRMQLHAIFYPKAV